MLPSLTQIERNALQDVSSHHTKTPPATSLTSSPTPPRDLAGDNSDDELLHRAQLIQEEARKMLPSLTQIERNTLQDVSSHHTKTPPATSLTSSPTPPRDVAGDNSDDELLR
jgi:hypothetical protein